MNKTIAIGTEVRDEAGRIGTVKAVTEYNGGVWYDVRFERDVAVRYPEELEVVS